MEKSQNENTSMLYVTFNQDSSCFAIGTETGFSIYNSFPFKDSFQRDMNGGIGIIEMLNRCNILALVGGGKNPKYAQNKVVIWDDHQSKVISELRFISYVKNVKLKRDKIFVVCDQKIFIFAFISFDILDTLETFDNPKGIIAVSTDSSTCIVAYPGKSMGSVNIKNYDTGKESTINAHQNMLSCISLSSNGSLLATASEKGTLIRVYNTSDGTLLKELRRGTENAEIYSIAFEPSGKFIACSSDRKTIHIFILGADGQNPTANGNKGQNVGPAKEEQEEPKNHKSVLGKITNFFGVQKSYFNSEWSFAQFRINDTKAICSFGPDNSIIVISSEGKYYQAEYDPKNGGECTKIQEKDIFEKVKAESK